ncbi:MAG: hypothetical protein WA885_10980 [Phormidesmis sp.]
MTVRKRLQTDIENLQQQLADLKAQGPFLLGMRVERTAAGGTASKESRAECKYARLRAGKGKRLENGKKSKYIPIREIDRYQAMCDRGKAITQLDRKIQKHQKKLRWLNTIATSLDL